MSSALIAKQTGLVFAGPVGSLDAYIDRVSQIAVLSKEDEVALAARFRSEGDLEAARQLVLSHLRFVVHIARGYLGYGLPMGDLVQEGNVGLMKAVKRFDPGVGVRLVSFAVHWIRAEIHEYVLRNWRLVKVATTKSPQAVLQPAPHEEEPDLAVGRRDGGSRARPRRHGERGHRDGEAPLGA